ncbi:MAG: hypothetical protein ABI780_15200 [Ardenticatenales bacterium]
MNAVLRRRHRRATTALAVALPLAFGLAVARGAARDRVLHGTLSGGTPANESSALRPPQPPSPTRATPTASSAATPTGSPP